MTSGARLRIAVVGPGVAGLSAAWLVSRGHYVIVYEKANRIGGHSNAVLAPIGCGLTPVDTGFIVFNPRTYPNFTRLLKALALLNEPSPEERALLGAFHYSRAPGQDAPHRWSARHDAVIQPLCRLGLSSPARPASPTDFAIGCSGS